MEWIYLTSIAICFSQVFLIWQVMRLFPRKAKYLTGVMTPRRQVHSYDVAQAVARGYCSPKNKNKILDHELVNSIVDEVIKIL